MTRREAISAVRSGTTITAAAVKFGVSRATLHRWLRAFNPDRPIASARPRKSGPKGPRWNDETVTAVIAIIEDHPDWWGRTRVGAALSDRGVVLSEKTVGKILKVARERLAAKLARDQRAAQARRSRQIAAMIRRDEREAMRRDMVAKYLSEILMPGVPVEEAVSKLVAAFAAKGWKFETKDLTPELGEFADAYLRAVRANPEYLADNEDWLLSVDRWPDQDHARVAAINHFIKRNKDAGRESRLPMVPAAPTLRRRQTDPDPV
jgi:transposase